jgi:hypothetical protein
VKLGRAERHRAAVALSAVLRSSRTLPGRQNDAYRLQKTAKADGHVRNIGSLQEVRETRCAEDVPTCAERHIHGRGPREGRR